MGWNKKWTEEDDRNLIAWYPKYTKWELARTFGVTKSALEARVSGLRTKGALGYDLDKPDQEQREIIENAMKDLSVLLGCSPLKAQEIVGKHTLLLECVRAT